MSAEQPQRESPQKRPGDAELQGDAKKFKPNPPANRYSCASMSQEESVEEPVHPTVKRDPPYFTPILTRSNLRGFSRPLREESKSVPDVCPPNPRLARSPPKQRLSDQAMEESIVKEEFERQSTLLIDRVLEAGQRNKETDNKQQSKELEEKQAKKSKTPTPRRDEILHARSTPRSQIVLVVQEPHLVDQRCLSDPKPASEPVSKPDFSPFPTPPSKVVEPKPVEDGKSDGAKPDLTKVDTVKPDLAQSVSDAKGLTEPVKHAGVAFVLPPEQFKDVSPESPGFASSSSVSEKSSEEQPSKIEDGDTSELSPIKDLCDRPEEAKPVPPVVVPVPEPKPIFPGLHVNANPFTEPPPADNPFLKPMVAERPATFVFGQSATYNPPPAVPPPQSAFPNPFLSAPSPIVPNPWHAPPTHPGSAMEDAEMKAETPKAMNFPGYPGQHYIPPPPVAPPFPQAPMATFPQPFQPFGAFQTSLGQEAQPPSGNAGGNFSIGNVGARRIYRAKRPGQ